MKRRHTLALAAAAVCVMITGCGDDGKKEQAAAAPAAQEKSALKVAWLYPSPRADEGWSKQHDEARELVQKQFGDKIQTTFVENVVGTADAERVIRDLAAQGNKLIFATSFEFMNPGLKVAKEYPDVKFEHCTGYKTAPNFNYYNARFYQARYLAGKLAGSMTKNGRLGYVAAVPIPEVLQGINAYTLGAQSVNPNIEVRVVWTNAWYDPGKEADAAKTLIGQGCDIISHHTNSQAVAAAGEDAKVPVISYHAEMHKAAPTMLIGAVTHHWDEYYAKRIQAVLDGTWKTAPMWGGAELHMVRLSGITPKALKAVVDDINATYAKMEKQAFNVFTGPIVDNTGKTVIPAGSAADDKHLLTMNYFVKGVLGKVPSGARAFQGREKAGCPNADGALWRPCAFFTKTAAPEAILP